MPTYEAGEQVGASYLPLKKGVEESRSPPGGRRLRRPQGKEVEK